MRRRLHSALGGKGLDSSRFQAVALFLHGALIAVADGPCLSVGTVVFRDSAQSSTRDSRRGCVIDGGGIL